MDMSETPCALCATPVSDATVCSGCGRRLELALGDVPALVADLENVLAKLTVYSDQAQRVTGSKDDTIVPFNIRAGETRQALTVVLRSWVMIVHQEKPTPRQLPIDRTSSCAAYLLHEVGWMRTQRWADEAIGNLLTVIGDVRHCLDAPAGRKTDPLGNCPVDDCDGEVRAYLPRDPDTMAHADCTVEPLHTWDSTQFLRLGRRMLRVEEVA